MTDSPSSSASTEDTGDLESALAAIQRRDPSGPIPRPTPTEPVRSARSNRRAALGLVLVGLLVAGVIQMVTATPDLRGEPNTGTRAAVVFSNAQAGACINWPPDAPDQPSFVQCRDNHMFEVAKSVDMSNFGEPCQAAVRSYLGPRYDPNSRFTIGVLWAGDADSGQNSRNLLCGLQLLGVDGKPTAFKGSVAELDQSKVWLPGTCLGFDAAGHRSTDIPVDCAKEHAVEITGSVGLAERFPGGPPPEPEEDAYVREACTRLTEGYLAPVPLQATGLTLNYSTPGRASWAAGSRQAWCGVVSSGDEGLNPLVGSVRGPAPGDQAPPPPPPPAPAPVSEPPPPPPAATTTTAAPTTTTVVTTPSATSQAPAPPASPSPAATTSATTPSSATPLGPPPGPPPGAPPPPESTEPPPGVILVPGLPPITLPGFAPPAPEPPAPPAPAPAPVP